MVLDFILFAIHLRKIKNILSHLIQNLENERKRFLKFYISMSLRVKHVDN